MSTLGKLSTSVRRGGAHMGFSERHGRYESSWTELLNCRPRSITNDFCQTRTAVKHSVMTVFFGAAVPPLRLLWLLYEAVTPTAAAAEPKDHPMAPSSVAAGSPSINYEHWARNSKITKLLMFLPILLRQSESSLNIFLLSVTRAFHEGYWILFKHIVLTKWLSQFCPSMYSSPILLHTVTGGRVKFWKTTENLTASCYTAHFGPFSNDKFVPFGPFGTVPSHSEGWVNVRGGKANKERSRAPQAGQAP